MITDFGLSVSGTFKKEKKLKKVPTKYLAPETLTHTHFNQETDMYSFGMFIYEVFHEGPEMDELYGGMDVETVKGFVTLGFRLGIQKWAQYPSFLWDLTKRCWEDEPAERITSAELVKEIEEEDRDFNGGVFHSRLHGQWEGVSFMLEVEDGWNCKKYPPGNIQFHF